MSETRPRRRAAKRTPAVTVPAELARALGEITAMDTNGDQVLDGAEMEEALRRGVVDTTAGALPVFLSPLREVCDSVLAVSVPTGQPTAPSDEDNRLDADLTRYLQGLRERRPEQVQALTASMADELLYRGASDATALHVSRTAEQAIMSGAANTALANLPTEAYGVDMGGLCNAAGLFPWSSEPFIAPELPRVHRTDTTPVPRRG